jgi:pimeloyl-ACP methyl ester carboxylesterase
MQPQPAANRPRGRPRPARTVRAADAASAARPTARPTGPGETTTGARLATGTVDYSHLLAGLIPQARVKIYPDSAHGFLFQHHAEFAADVNEFLAGPA